MQGILAGRVAWVTGASSGIGAGTALCLARAGAAVAITGRRAERLQALAREIEAAGGSALVLPGDVTQEDFAPQAAARIPDRYGRLDILVNSAGILRSGTIGEGSLAEYRQVVDVNLMGTVYCSRAVIPRMKAQRGGNIINICSLADYQIAAPFNAYCASKHAVSAMSDAMRQELGGFGIRVCNLTPGAVTTEVAEHLTDPPIRAAIQQHVTTDAIRPENIGDIAVFIAALPPEVNIDRISVRPTADVAP